MYDTEDYLEIFDGQNDQSTQIEKLTGSLGSFGVSSTGNLLFIKFKSDYYQFALNDDGSTGFLATIQYGNQYLYIK